MGKLLMGFAALMREKGSRCIHTSQRKEGGQRDPGGKCTNGARKRERGRAMRH